MKKEIEITIRLGDGREQTDKLTVGWHESLTREDLTRFDGFDADMELVRHFVEEAMQKFGVMLMQLMAKKVEPNTRWLGDAVINEAQRAEEEEG